MTRKKYQTPRLDFSATVRVARHRVVVKSDELVDAKRLVEQFERLRIFVLRVDVHSLAAGVRWNRKLERDTDRLTAGRGVPRE